MQIVDKGNLDWAEILLILEFISCFRFLVALC